MALQKRRLSKSRVGHRRSAWAARFKKPLVNACPSCGEPKLPHRVCMSCGHFRDGVVVEGVAKAEDAE